jgi:hypothetical protein
MISKRSDEAEAPAMVAEATPEFKLNRRMRNRTSGGVGERRA